VHGQSGGIVAWPEIEIAQYAEKLIAERDAIGRASIEPPRSRSAGPATGLDK
jgi:hypothetical protein